MFVWMLENETDYINSFISMDELFKKIFSKILKLNISNEYIYSSSTTSTCIFQFEIFHVISYLKCECKTLDLLVLSWLTSSLDFAASEINVVVSDPESFR